MCNLDNDGKRLISSTGKSVHDFCQFVPFPVHNGFAQIRAKEVQKEIPDQFLFIMLHHFVKPMPIPS